MPGTPLLKKMEPDSFRHTQISVYLVGLSLASVVFYDSAKVGR